MTALFGRAFGLTVGTLEVSDFRCKFKVEKTLKPDPNKVLVEVYNLSREHRGALAELAPGKAIKLGKQKKKGVVAKPQAGKIPVRLSVGYGEDTDQIFLGDLRTVDSEIDGPDWVTAITSGDGERAYRTARVNQAFGPKTPVSAALTSAVKALGLGSGNLSAVLSSLKLQGQANLFARGIVLSGSAARVLTDLCRSADLEWSIQDGVIQFVDFGRVLAGRSVLVSPGTGMIGSPNVSSDGICNFKSLIIPGLRCGGVVVIEAATLDGNFRVEKLAYDGDTHGREWTVEGWGKRY
jgi:hypothetical protein